jgi:hypothetical protein
LLEPRGARTVRPRWLRHGTVANPAQPASGFRPPNLSGSSRIGNRRQRSCYFDLVRYFFLKRPKIEISENLRFLARSFPCRPLFLAVIVLPASLDLSGRIETEQ